MNHGEPPDNLIVPAELPPLTRTQLKSALKAIVAAQHQLSRYAPYGI